MAPILNFRFPFSYLLSGVLDCLENRLILMSTETGEVHLLVVD